MKTASMTAASRKKDDKTMLAVFKQEDGTTLVCRQIEHDEPIQDGLIFEHENQRYLAKFRITLIDPQLTKRKAMTMNRRALLTTTAAAMTAACVPAVASTEEGPHIDLGKWEEVLRT